MRRPKAFYCGISIFQRVLLILTEAQMAVAGRSGCYECSCKLRDTTIRENENVLL